MSRQNKVNPGQYTSAGRLSPDDLGRERRLQRGKAASTGVLQGTPGAPGAATTTATKPTKAPARTGNAPARTPPAAKR